MSGSKKNSPHQAQKFPPRPPNLIIAFLSLMLAWESGINFAQSPFPTAFAQSSSDISTDDTPPFNDVHVEDRHFVALQYLKKQGLIEGYTDGTFRPNDDIKRVEALSFLFKVLKPATPKKLLTIDFKDVHSEDWFFPIVQEAYSKWVVDGYPDKLFHPEKTINKVEALKTALLLENDDLPTSLDQKPYSDVETDAWFASYAEISKERELFSESRDNGGELNGDETLTRGEFAEFVYRLLESRDHLQFGRASFYADGLAGRHTSGGDNYIPDHFTAAHLSLPFGTKILVTNLANGKSVIVTVNDRGPYATGIHLDLSKSAFAAIASPGAGIINVEYKGVE